MMIQIINDIWGESNNTYSSRILDLNQPQIFIQRLMTSSPSAPSVSGKIRQQAVGLQVSQMQRPQ